ncbi:phosphatase PAP2 family protein [Paenibacillus yanchengensis]|uniref:Phosphatase PAP2 family protein n=1 Tax=Paenibacillus yanchengensis TaxID=2035833 RepID=A0ABW4YG54_9BACL
MLTFAKKNWHLLAVLTIALQGLIYLAIGQSIQGEPFYNYFWIDTKIPFITWFVIPYVIWMPILYLGFIYIGLKNKPLFWKTIITYNAAVMVCNVIFILFPTYVPRPEIINNDLLSYAVTLVYSNDEPLNCLPSVHVLTSYILLITMNRHKLLTFKWRIVFSVILWSIIFSTIFIKQHALIDLIAGIALGEVVYRAVHYYANRVQQRKHLDNAKVLSS